MTTKRGAFLVLLILCAFALVFYHLMPSNENGQTGAYGTPPPQAVASVTQAASLKPTNASANKATLTTLDIASAAKSGLYDLSPVELWELTQKHPDLDVRRVACYIPGCIGYARAVEGKIEPESKHDLYKSYCAGLVDSNPGYFLKEYEEFYFRSDARCGELSLGGVTSTKRLEEIDATEAEIANGLSTASTPNDFLGYTILAIQLERGLDNVNYKLLKGSGTGEAAIRSLTPFIGLLATKFGCHLPGYCEAGSLALFTLCASHSNIVCVPGDNLNSLAERNLPPIQYDIWQRAHVRQASR